MNCQRFETLLVAWVDERLSPSQRESMALHAGECEACASALRLAESFAVQSAPADAADDGWVASVLARTSGRGRACEASQRLMRDGLDKNLPGEDAQLLDMHVAGCASCRALRRVLAWLPAEMPQAASIEPGEAFTQGVLAATRELEEVVAQPRWIDRVFSQVAASLDQRLRRPRGGLELAYLATVVLVVLCGTPRSPFPKAPGQALALMQSAPVEISEVAARAAGGPAALVSDLEVRVQKGSRTVSDEMQTFWKKLWNPTSPEGDEEQPTTEVEYRGEQS